MKTRTAALATTMFIGLAGAALPSYAAPLVVRVDLQATSGGFGHTDAVGVEADAAAANAAFGTNGANVWNNIGAPSYPTYTTDPQFSNLLDSDGHATSINFALTGPVTFAADGDYVSNTSNIVENDYLVTFLGQTSGYTISGLAANSAVSFYNYAPNFAIADRGYTLTANGQLIAVPSGATHNALTTIMTSNTGTISGTFTTSNVEGNWSGFQLAMSAVPEPGTWAMMLLGFAMIGAAGRRRSKVRTVVAFA